MRGLEEHSRAPLSSPNETSQSTIDLILAEHGRYGWGARKILKRLQGTHPQRVLNTFVQTYNDVRPHEALNDETPASRWHPSARPLPTRIVPPTYPGHFEVRRISTAGTFRLHNGQQFLTQALNGEMIGLEEVHVGAWNVLYYETLLGHFDEQTRTITGAPSLKKDC